MPNAIAVSYEEIARDVIAAQRLYPSGFVYPKHTHTRGQFAYAAEGVMTVSTEMGNWVVPFQCAAWLPAEFPHSMQMSGPVRMLNAFIRAPAQQVHRLPPQCCVLGTSPLLRELMAQAIHQPALYEPGTRAERIMALLVDEIAAMPPLALNAPLPDEPRLAALCRGMLAAPSLSLSIDDAARSMGLSRRSFTRLFREHLAMSFAAWREQACLIAAIERFARGEAVTRVALDLGYGSPTAFSTMFKRVMGMSPLRYLEMDEARAARPEPRR